MDIVPDEIISDYEPSFSYNSQTSFGLEQSIPKLKDLMKAEIPVPKDSYNTNKFIPDLIINCSKINH